MTRNLTAAGPYNGITLQPGIDGVTIDLMGFTLDGNRGSVASNYGIVVTSSQGSVTRNLTIRNGTIRNWGLTGVAANNALLGRFEDLTVAGNGGVGLHTGPASIVQRVIAYENGSDGIRLVQIGPYGGGNVLQSLATHNGGDGIDIGAAQVIVDGNTFNSNGQGTGGAGIRISADDVQVRNNETVWNAYGIYIEPGDHHTLLARNRAAHNLVEDCHDIGFYAAVPYPNEWGPVWGDVNYLFGYNYTSPFDAMLNFCGTMNPPPP